MPSELKVPAGWSAVPLAELTSTGSVTYGVVQPGADTPAGTPLIRVNNFTGNGLDATALMRIAPHVESKYERTRLQAGDVLITIVGTVGNVAVVPPSMTGWNIARAVALVRPKSPELSRWIAFCLRSPFTKHALGVAANTTVQTTINLKDLKQLLLPMPPESERIGLVEVLSALDDRIDLLRQTNTTLESIAQALFKSWFIDFDPVRAKAEGREPEGMDAATAALFPAGFEVSALGLTPKGWSVKRLGELLELVYGKALKADDRKDGAVPVYGSGGITGFHDKALVPHGSVIVGRKGTVGSLYWEDRPFFPIDTTFYVRPTAAPLTFCYYTMQRLGLESMNTDAAVPGLNRENAYRLNVVVPTDALLASFDAIAMTIRNSVHANIRRAETLVNTRDALLPRLITGKLLLPELPQQLDEAFA